MHRNMEKKRNIKVSFSWVNARVPEKKQNMNTNLGTLIRTKL